MENDKKEKKEKEKEREEEGKYGVQRKEGGRDRVKKDLGS